MGEFMLDHLTRNFKFFEKTVSTATLPGGASLFGQQPGGRQRQGEAGQVAQGQGFLEENPA